jgi:glycosyltransferase involved in cell wall biosynthesis
MPNSEQGRKTIVILSTEPWGKMLLSKMHYAIELAELGNRVYFVNPPADKELRGLAAVAGQQGAEGITIIDIKALLYALFLRHKFFPLYRKWVTGRYIRAILSLVGGPVDEVWCFDPHTYVDLSAFRAKKAVLLIYDLYTGRHVFKAAETADALVTISRVILDHYASVATPKLLLQHGLSKHFSRKAEDLLGRHDFRSRQGEKIRIGYTGNLLRPGMNTTVAKDIIDRHPDMEFHFWGPSSLENNNVSSVNLQVSQDIAAFIGYLESRENVVLHGVKEQSELAGALFGMDAFLFLYSAAKDLNGASNSHKLLEYLSTGKPVISTHVSNYAGLDLLEMGGAGDEDRLPELFNEVMQRLPDFSSPERQQKRIGFALDNTYKRQVIRIEEFITGH